MVQTKSFKQLLIPLSFISLVAFIFRSLVTNISTNLSDWLDYPLMVWIINQNLDHIKGFQLNSFFESNIFYPHHGTLLFSDLLIPPTILALIFNLFSSNQILVFNLVFFSTIFLNIWASWLFWGVLFSDKRLLFFGTLITAFSPFFFLSLGHFQMVNLWPFLFGLHFLFKEKFSIKNALIIGSMISLEFLSSVYLGIFMLIAISVWYLLKISSQYFRGKVISKILTHGVAVLVTFILTSGFFIFKYIQIKQDYGIIRDPSEYVTYSAHITDFLFTNHYNSVVSSLYPSKLWNSFNKHTIGESGAFPGIALLLLALFGMFKIIKEKKLPFLSLNLSYYNCYFIILIILGFLFSLGPRFSANGIYLGVPLPYYPVQKFVPIVEPVRANARWIFLLFLGLSYFALLGLQKLIAKTKLGKIFVMFLSILVLLETAPINKLTGKKEYYPLVYKKIEEICLEDPKVLLEYPMSRFIMHNNIIENLTYRSQLQLASIKHKCSLVNGYSGYIPKEYEEYESTLFWAIEKKDENLFWKLLTDKRVKFFKLNKDSLYEDRVKLIESWLSNKSGTKIYLNDNQYFLAEINGAKI